MRGSNAVSYLYGVASECFAKTSFNLNKYIIFVATFVYQLL